MSDFKHPFWSYWVAAIAIAGIVYCLIILISQLRAKTNKPGQEDLKPHVWDDDLQEYNNPMPRWWVFMFLATTVAAIVYLIAYPGLGSFKGLLGWSSAGVYATELKENDEKTAPLYKAYLGTPIDQLAQDPQAMKLGERLFQNNCAQCHGVLGTGAKGFPNLTDSDWLYGGSPEIIERTILDGRNGVMEAQAKNLGSPVAVNDVANYVLSLSGRAHDPVASARGKDLFANKCASCHTPEGTGSFSDKTGALHATGAPNLTDKVWLYRGDLNTITETITQGRNNVMPSWECVLGEARVHVLAAYVWQLNKGERVQSTPDYLANVMAADQQAWLERRASAKAAGQPECSANSVPMLKKIAAEKEKQAAAQPAAVDAKQ